MKHKKLLFLAGLTAAVLGFASLEPMAQGNGPTAMTDRSAGVKVNGTSIQIVPASAEAARIPPELLAELQSVANP